MDIKLQSKFFQSKDPHLLKRKGKRSKVVSLNNRRQTARRFGFADSFNRMFTGTDSDLSFREDFTNKLFNDVEQDRLERKTKEEYSEYTKSRNFSEIPECFVEKNLQNYIKNFIDISNENTLFVTSNNSIFNENIFSRKENLISLSKLNDIRYINKYFERINDRISLNGRFVGCFETFSARRKRKLIDKVPVVREIYFSLEFIFLRVIPKIPLLKQLYFKLTKGKGRLLSKAEGLGRLVSCGFEILDYKSLNGLVYFVAKKVRNPYFDATPSYGPIFKMSRIGKDGKEVKVFKFRTMHPYSEYLQDYVLKRNGYAETGKPANDFRIPVWGKFMRKFWLDELPQLINVIKGDMKLVGIRPVSKRYFQDIPKEMQKLRLTQKPGCIPPYVALNRPGNVISVLQAEKEYLEEIIRNPRTTDLKYLFQAVYNIIFHNKRSA